MSQCKHILIPGDAYCLACNHRILFTGPQENLFAFLVGYVARRIRKAFKVSV